MQGGGATGARARAAVGGLGQVRGGGAHVWAPVWARCVGGRVGEERRGRLGQPSSILGVADRSQGQGGRY